MGKTDNWLSSRIWLKDQLDSLNIKLLMSNWYTKYRNSLYLKFAVCYWSLGVAPAHSGPFIIVLRLVMEHAMVGVTRHLSYSGLLVKQDRNKRLLLIPQSSVEHFKAWKQSYRMLHDQITSEMRNIHQCLLLPKYFSPKVQKTIYYLEPSPGGEHNTLT